MKIYVRNRRREREGSERAELEINVGGMTEREAEDFVDDVKRRVTVKKRKERCDQDRDDSGRYCRSSNRNRQTVDVNINVRAR